MRYILFLRGINVGGKNKISMTDLKALLENAGFENLDSYINSGNLFFSSAESREACILKIRKVLEINYDFSIPFALLTKEEYLEEQAALPDWWEEELARRDVLFYSCTMDKSDILHFIENATFYNEKVYVGKQAVFWGKMDEAEYLKTTYHKKLMKQDFYKQITIRNGNTFDKIAEMLRSRE